MTAMFRVSLVHAGRSGSAVLVRAEMSPANNRSGDMRCDATIGLLQIRTDASSVKGQNPITAKSAVPTFTLRKCCMMHEWLQSESRSAELCADFNGRLGPILWKN